MNKASSSSYLPQEHEEVEAFAFGFKKYDTIPRYIDAPYCLLRSSGICALIKRK